MKSKDSFQKKYTDLFICGKKNIRHPCESVNTKFNLVLTARNSGDCKALDKKSEILPSFKLLICRHRDCKGVLKISGS